MVQLCVKSGQKKRPRNFVWQSENSVGNGEPCFCSRVCGNRQWTGVLGMVNFGSYGEYIMDWDGVKACLDTTLRRN